MGISCLALTNPFLFVDIAVVLISLTLIWATTPQGNRLGSANDPPPQLSAAAARSGSSRDKVNLPEKRIDPSVTESDRARQREAVLAAAEKRQKAGGVSTKKKKKPKNTQPLRGPNTEPLMRWNV